MSRHEKLPSAARHYDMHARIVRLGDNLKFGMLLDICTAHFRMAAVRNEKHIIESTKDRQLLETLAHVMFENAEHLLAELVFRHAVIMVQPRLRSPADIERRSDVRACPVENGLKFAPVVHALKIEVLHRRARDNHPVELLAPHQVEVAVERLHVLYRRVLRGVALQLHKAHLYLQRRVGEQADEVGLGGNLNRHQVEDDDFQRTDVLCARARRVDNEDILFLQQINGGQFIR